MTFIFGGLLCTISNSRFCRADCFTSLPRSFTVTSLFLFRVMNLQGQSVAYVTACSVPIHEIPASSKHTNVIVTKMSLVVSGESWTGGTPIRDVL